MKNPFSVHFLFFILLCFSTNALHAQVVTDTIPLPTGYTVQELFYRNTLNIDLHNNVWVGFREIGAAKFNGSVWTVYDSTNSGLPVNNVTAFLFTANFIWIGTTAGIVKYDGSSWTLYNKINSGFNSDTVNCLEWNNGILYVGTNQGLFSFDGNAWNKYYSGNTILRHDTISSMTLSDSDSLWLGTNNGLYCLSNGLINYIGLENEYSLYGNVWKLLTDSSNTVWVGSGPFPYYTTNLIRNGTLKTLNELFYSDCTGYPLNPLIMCKSGDGGVWTYQTDMIGSLSSPAFKIDAGIPKYSRYKNIFSGHIGVFSDLKFIEHDLTDKIWTIKKNGSDFNNYILRIHYEGLVVADTSVLDCYQLDVNQVRTRLWPDGNSHWDQVGNAAYEVPKGSGKNALFCNGFWIGGNDPGNNLHLAATTYRQSGMDYWPGPLDTITATSDAQAQAQYNKIWKVNRTTIAEFVQQFTLGNVNNGSYTVPQEILSWPGNGGGNYSRMMAPFIDFNRDGIYNPFDGDRPDIKGDQFLWWVFNDNFLAHTETGGSNLGIEVHASAYAWNCQGLTGVDTIINYTTFYQFDIYNRSDTNYHDVHLGVYTDVDLGYYLDDFVGSSGEKGFVYVYNGDSIDEGILGYGENPPMLDYVVLQGPEAVPLDGIDNNYDGVIDESGEHTSVNSFMYYDNDFSAGVGNPSAAPHYYTYIQSLWKDSIHLTYGLNGRGGNSEVNFMFTGTPYDTGWTEMNTGNEPSDRRWIAGSGPFDLPSRGNRTLDFAYVYSRFSSAPNGLNTSISQNNIDVARIQSMWNSQIFPCSNGVIGIEEISQKYSLNIFPNPTHDYLLVKSNKSWDGEATWKILDLAGRIVLEGRFKQTGENKISLPNLAHGVYFINCRDKSAIYQGKFVAN